MNYEDLSVHVGRRAGKAYPVDVECFGAQYHGEIRLADLQATTLQNRLRRIADRQADEPTVKALGLDLYRLLFHHEVYAGLVSSRAQANARNLGLRFKLRLDDPELAALPWEYMAEEDSVPFAASSQTPLVRFIPLPIASKPLTVDGPLRLLIMASQPADLPALDVDQERQRIEEALKPLKTRGLVDWRFTTAATRYQLQQELMKPYYHVLHFIGHGVFDTRKEPSQGCLAFQREDDGRSDLVAADDLAELLQGSSVQLVLLNACETAAFDQQPFRAVAPALVRAQIPAVIAMQYLVEDAAAIAFSRLFYTALANECPVDAAVCEGRKGIRGAGPASLDWGIPVLYMRAEDGVIFRKKAAEPPRGRKPLLPIDVEEMASLQRRLGIHQQKLADLRRQQALYGADAPLRLLQEIDWREAELAKIKARLAEFGSGDGEMGR